jgi:hypothetical protein
MTSKHDFLIPALLMMFSAGVLQAAPTIETSCATAIAQDVAAAGAAVGTMLDQIQAIATSDTVPDGGITLILLGVVLLIIETLRRKLFS